MIIERSEYHNYFHLKKLLEIHDCPPLLYMEGNIDLLHKEYYYLFSSYRAEQTLYDITTIASIFP